MLGIGVAASRRAAPADEYDERDEMDDSRMLVMEGRRALQTSTLGAQKGKAWQGGWAERGDTPPGLIVNKL
ncbi:hypothetical protein ACG7TL_004994 [Trametes sanguinea]